MKYFCIPADFKKETIDELEKLNNQYKQHSRVVETYGNVTIGYNFGSGRVLPQLPGVDLLDLQQYVEYSQHKKIEFNYTFNLPYMQNKEFKREGILQIKEFISELYKIGIRSLTIALPSLLEIVNSLDYDFKIKASTICHITNANKALAYKRMGFDRIVIDESVHRDFQTLREIRKAIGPGVELIVNTMCHRNCAYRHFHYNQTGGDSLGVPNEVGINFFEHKCLLQRYDTIGGLLKLGWIRPEDLHYYTAAGFTYFKLQGRQHVEKGDHIKTLIHYLEESYDGNLMSLLDMFNPRYSFQISLDNKKLDGFIKPFYEKTNFCRQNCSDCNYCETFSKKCIDHKKAAETIADAKTFYNDYDQFIETIHSLDIDDPCAAVEPRHIENELDFDFD